MSHTFGQRLLDARIIGQGSFVVFGGVRVRLPSVHPSPLLPRSDPGIGHLNDVLLPGGVALGEVERPHVEVAPVEEVEDEEEEGGAVEEEPVDAGVLVVPRGVVSLDERLTPLPLHAVSPRRALHQPGAAKRLPGMKRGEKGCVRRKWVPIA